MTLELVARDREVRKEVQILEQFKLMDKLHEYALEIWKDFLNSSDNDDSKPYVFYNFSDKQHVFCNGVSTLDKKRYEKLLTYQSFDMDSIVIYPAIFEHLKNRFVGKDQLEACWLITELLYTDIKIKVSEANILSFNNKDKKLPSYVHYPKVVQFGTDFRKLF